MNRILALFRRCLPGALALLMLAAAFAARAQGAGADFDHLRTGFALTGVHTTTRCESCHIGGVFKGTPRDCESCHLSGARFARGNVVKNTQHIPTAAACETCHNTRSFSGARMNHSAVARGTCTSCHNGVQASGKAPDHFNTTVSCDTCHGTAAWRPASRFDHAGVAPGSCATCHDGTKAIGRSSSHTPFQLVAGLAGTACDSCHKAGFTAWTPARLHTSVSVTAQCATCHLPARPSNAIHNGQTTCESCHKTTGGWAGAKVDHAALTSASDCTGCHNGQAATGKAAAHIPVGATNCVACHGTSNWKPSKFNHTQVAVTAQCATCHSGTYPPADGKPAIHTPYQLVSSLASANCDSCHKAGYTAWAPAKLHASVTVTTQCATCHQSARPSNATHNGQTVCENCHKGSTTWTGAKVDHSGYTAATDCASCHNGSNATGKQATHIPTGAAGCASCHSPTAAGWKPTRFNHTQVPVAAQCTSCHSGSYPPADGKSASHTPYQLVSSLAGANCDSCHKSGYTVWTPAKVHANAVVTAQCSTCHLSARPTNATHSGQTVCETCHKSTTTWIGAKVDHSIFTAATNCASCHNGSGASGKPTTHIPVGAANCVSCHGTTTWRPSSFNHSQVPVTAQCASCHTGTYPPADGKSASHTPYQLVASTASANCDTCHKSGYTAWTPAKLHANAVVTAQCSTCHLSARPTNATHSGQTVCETCHKSTTTWIGAKVDHTTFTAATNCSSCHNGSGASGKPTTHIPVAATNCVSCHGTTTWRPSKFNHTQVPVTAQCASCHTGTYPPADGKSASHTPYQLVATIASANCDTCHKSGYTAWTPARLHANAVVTAQCSTCHLSARPTNATHSGQTVCETCHKSTSTWIGAKVDHTTFTVATNCSSCHNGSGATGKPVSHIPVGATNCVACHSPTQIGWRPTKFNHTQVPVTAQCASCHTGTYPPADGKPAAHLPYQLVATTASANCDTCHKGSFTTWATGKVHASTVITGQCKTCHSGAYVSQGATAKPVMHIPESQLLNGAAMECNACHKTTSSWSSTMNHNGSMGGGAGWCKGCHQSGTSYLGGLERKSLTHRTKTPPAIDCSESGCHRPLGSKGTTYINWD